VTGCSDGLRLETAADIWLGQNDAQK